MARMLAKVTCPGCKQPFSTPVEQILDVEVNSSAKGRLLSGQVNLAVCPHCGAAGALDLPFLYHDPAKELALVFVSLAAGRNDVERQQVIGALSRALMSQLPSEMKKGYLLSPEVFLTYESLLKRVLEAEGITEEVLEQQQAKGELLRRLVSEMPDEERAALIRENESSLDEEFFDILYANVAQAEMMGRDETVERLAGLRDALAEQTAVGRRLAAQEQTLEKLQEQPTRGRLLDLLVSTEDQSARTLLIALGQPLLDYVFFQALTQRIEEQGDEGERERLVGLRQEVLDIREQVQQHRRAMFEARARLLRDLTLTEQPELLARRRLREIDELFFAVLSAEIERARAEGESTVLSRLSEVRDLLVRLLAEMMPPELVLLEKVMGAEDAKQAREVVEQNRNQLGPGFLGLLEQAEVQLRERGDSAVAERLQAALTVARTIVEPNGGLVRA